MTQYPLALAGPALAREYDAQTLNANDRERLQKSPALAERTQWQTSRALLHRLRSQYPAASLSLSHKHDHALVAIHLEQDKPGADLEYLRPRDVIALAQQTCSPEEIAHMAQTNEPKIFFYQLWTLKEALVKAEDLRFPTDLRRVGLDPASGQLRATRDTAYRWISLLLDERWIASAIWPDRGSGACHLQLHDCAMQNINILGGNLTLNIEVQ